MATEATTPKPRKFFKSRTAQAAAAAAAQAAQQAVQETPVVEEAPPPPVAPKPVKPKQSKKKAAVVQEYPPPVQETVHEPPVQPEVIQEPEPIPFIPQPSVSQDRIRETIPSKRYLARARKVQVNYNEDESSQPPKVTPTGASLPPPASMMTHPAPSPMTVPMSAVSPSMEHPPIVLRISKVSWERKSSFDVLNVKECFCFVCKQRALCIIFPILSLKSPLITIPNDHN